MSHLVLKNPHSVLAALQTRPQDVFEVRLERSSGDAWQQVDEAARCAGVTVRETMRSSPPAHGRGDEKQQRTGTSEGVLRERPGVELSQLFPPDEGDSGLWLALDQIQDPRNVGAIFRTAAFFGVRGVILTRNRSAPLTATVYDVASGGLEYVPYSQQTNLARAVDFAKEAGLWVLGASEHAETDVHDVDRDRRWLLVLGNEEHGLRRLTLKKCDQVCRLSPHGSITSLNVSVAAGVLMAALSR